MLACTILTTDAEIAAIADEWRELHRRATGNHLTDYDRLMVWWNALGKHQGLRWHIVTGRSEGKLVALLPLTVASRLGMRMLQPADRAGFECDALFENVSDVALLWQAARKSPHYDFARIEGAYPGTVCAEALDRIARRRAEHEYFHLRFDWPSSEAWKASLSSDLRGSSGRYVRRLEKKGPVRYDLYKSGRLNSDAVDAMFKTKTKALSERRKRGIFENPRMADYVRSIMQRDAEAGALFFNVLKCGDTDIAWNMGTVSCGVLNMTMWTYNPAWSTDSPATVLLVNSIGWAIDNGLKGMDLMYTTVADSEKYYKRKFANVLTTGYEYSFSGSLRGRLCEAAFMAAKALKKAIAANSASLGGIRSIPR